MKRSCRNCAFLRETHFKKSSKHYGKIIYWCKKKDCHPSSPTINMEGCDKHQTKAQRRKINAEITARWNNWKQWKEEMRLKREETVRLERKSF